jgi:hypothetical protein
MTRAAVFFNLPGKPLEVEVFSFNDQCRFGGAKEMERDRAHPE